MNNKLGVEQGAAAVAFLDLLEQLGEGRMAHRWRKGWSASSSACPPRPAAAPRRAVWLAAVAAAFEQAFERDLRRCMADVVELAGRGGPASIVGLRYPPSISRTTARRDLLGGEAKSARNRSKMPGLAVLLHVAEHRLERQLVVLVEADLMALLVAREESDARARQEAAAFGQLVFDPGGAEEVGLDRHHQAVADLAVFEMEAAGVEPQHGQGEPARRADSPSEPETTSPADSSSLPEPRDARHRQAAGLAGMFDESARNSPS